MIGDYTFPSVFILLLQITFSDLLLHYHYFLSIFTSEHVVPWPASRLETSPSRHVWNLMIHDICFSLNNEWDVNSYTLQMLTSQLLFSSARVLRILILSVSTSIFSLYRLWTITTSLPLQFSLYLFILFYFISGWFTTYPNNRNARLTCLPHRPFYCFLYSLDLSYLWPQLLFDKWGYDNPIYSPKSQHPVPNTWF